MNISEAKKEESKKGRFELICASRYEAYREFLVENGACAELIDLPIVDEIIQHSIRFGDPRVIFEGRSPVHYSNPREDGTFDISARMNGPCVTDVYHINFCDDGNVEHYISIAHESVSEYSVPLFDGIRYANRQGVFVNENQGKVKQFSKIS